MLWTITVILLVLWVLGLVSGSTMGAWVHILLVLAVISLIFAVLRRQCRKRQDNAGNVDAFAFR